MRNQERKLKEGGENPISQKHLDKHKSQKKYNSIKEGRIGSSHKFILQQHIQNSVYDQSLFG